MMQWSVIAQHLPQLLQGVFLTMLLTLCSLICGLFLSLLLTFCLERKINTWLNHAIQVFMFVFRGTPFIVQIFIIYYGFGQAVWVQHSFLWLAFKSPFFCAVLALTLNTAAYSTALFYGVINKMGKKDIEAAQAFALSNVSLYRHIILPRLFGLVMPAYSNEMVIVLKSTSLVSAIALAELTSTTQSIMGETYTVIPLLVFSGVLYLLLNSCLIFVSKMIHQRLTKHSRQVVI